MRFQFRNWRFWGGTFAMMLFLLPQKVDAAQAEPDEEQRFPVVMRMLGHELLQCLGDYESRVLPIAYEEEAYKITFEESFTFDPEDVSTVARQVMLSSGLAQNILVKVQDCKTEETVHAFVTGNAPIPDMLPCGGRDLPESCYYLLVTVLPDLSLGQQLPPSNTPSLQLASGPLSILQWGIVLLIVLLAGSAYFVFLKRAEEISDPYLLEIGDHRFDTKNMTLSYGENSVELSNKEAALLTLLHTSANEPLEREEILRKVWGDQGGYIGRTLDVFISKLRKKLEPDDRVKIVNIRGVGYKLVVN